MGNSLYELLRARGVSRRDFLKFCGFITTTLALSKDHFNNIVQAMTHAKRPVVVWLEFQSCTADTESILRTNHPDIATLILDTISLNYSETLMAAAGIQAERVLKKTLEEEKGKYLVVVEGSIPLAEEGIYCCIGGRSALEILKEVTKDAQATIAVGTCASYGGIAAASPNPTESVGIADAVKGIRVINLPGCPVNAVNIVAPIIHILTFGRSPETDSLGRPLFLYGQRIHDQCEHRSHYDAGQYVEKWGDEAHRIGWCLYKMGCKGPATYNNCPIVRWNDATSWPIQAGHGCVGCSEPNFWDSMTPFYQHLPTVPGFGVDTSAAKIGVGMVAGVGAAFAAHGIITALRRKGTKFKEEIEAKPEQVTQEELVEPPKEDTPPHDNH
jgi:hydrogenase small subunit